MGARILVVDDEPGVLRIMSDVLEPLGYEVLALSDSRVACEQLNRQKFDAAFVDVNMPHLDGFKMTELIRNSRSNNQMPVVMMTGLEDVELMQRGFKAGITFFLSKPFNPDRLRGLLNTMQSMILKERRRYMRLPLVTDATIERHGKSYRAQTVNISQGGMLLDSAPRIEVGEEAVVELKLPGVSKPIRTRIRVVRKDASGRIGAILPSLPIEDRATIQNYILGTLRS